MLLPEVRREGLVDMLSPSALSEWGTLTIAIDLEGGGVYHLALHQEGVGVQITGVHARLPVVLLISTAVPGSRRILESLSIAMRLDALRGCLLHRARSLFDVVGIRDCERSSDYGGGPLCSSPRWGPHSADVAVQVNSFSRKTGGASLIHSRVMQGRVRGQVALALSLLCIRPARHFGGAEVVRRVVARHVSVVEQGGEPLGMKRFLGGQLRIGYARQLLAFEICPGPARVRGMGSTSILLDRHLPHEARLFERWFRSLPVDIVARHDAWESMPVQQALVHPLGELLVGFLPISVRNELRPLGEEILGDELGAKRILIELRGAAPRDRALVCVACALDHEHMGPLVVLNFGQLVLKLVQPDFILAREILRLFLAPVLLGLGPLGCRAFLASLEARCIPRLPNNPLGPLIECCRKPRLAGVMGGPLALGGDLDGGLHNAFDDTGRGMVVQVNIQANVSHLRGAGYIVRHEKLRVLCRAGVGTLRGDFLAVREENQARVLARAEVVPEK